MGKGIGGHHSARANTEVWLTPPDLLAALGGPEAFDLDPCAAIDPYFCNGEHAKRFAYAVAGMDRLIAMPAYFDAIEKKQGRG